VSTADGQRRRYPDTAWQFRVRDERYLHDAVRDLSNVPPQQLPRERADFGLER